ncbi:MAG: hypothetical protein P4L90_26705 [Rhodopila sp.]|nr:hypothetical protein [Rhodopila sp.]
MFDLGETYDHLLTWIATHPRLAVDFGPWILVAFGIGSLCLTHWSSISHMWAPAAGRRQAERQGDRREITEPSKGMAQPPGRWIGARYVCDTPFHVFTALVTAKDNDRVQVFEVPHAPVDAMIETIVEIDRQDERVKAGIGSARSPAPIPLQWLSRQTKTSIRLPADRLLSLSTLAMPDADTTTIRVRVASWTIGKVAL